MRNVLSHLYKKLFHQGSHLTSEDGIYGGSFVAVGYPKVGNTWLRVTLGAYLQKHYRLAEMPLMDLGEFRALHDAGCRAIGNFTHAPLEWASQTADDLSYDSVVKPFEASRVLFLARNPLDTLVSSYMQERYRNKSTPFTGTLEEFLEHPVFGLEKLLKFYQIWFEGKEHVAGFYLWRYESAKASPESSFLQVLEFLGEDIDTESLQAAVQYASFDNLKNLEASKSDALVYKSSGLSIFGSEPTENNDARHVRKGEVGGYKREISQELADRLEKRIQLELPEYFGYR